jgi:hypothetical protein
MNQLTSVRAVYDAELREARRDAEEARRELGEAKSLIRQMKYQDAEKQDELTMALRKGVYNFPPCFPFSEQLTDLHPCWHQPLLLVLHLDLQIR